MSELATVFLAAASQRTDHIELRTLSDVVELVAPELGWSPSLVAG